MRYYHQDNVALGSRVELTLVLEDDSAKAAGIFQELWRTIFGFERQFSRFLPASELSMFNRSAGSTIKISPDFKDILLAAKDASEWSEGLYNPLILPALQRAGYVGSMVKQYKDDYVDDYSNRSVVPADKLEIGDDWARIPYGTALDLGGMGKGYLADKLAAMVDGKVKGFWFSLGGDIAAGGTDSFGRPWEVEIQDTEEPINGSAGQVRLPASGSFAVATSGTSKGGAKKGRSWHHIIDPRTLKPAKTDVLAATVFAQSALKADVLASCAVILGSAQGKKFLRRMDVSAALLQGRDTRRRSFRVKFGKAIKAAA